MKSTLLMLVAFLLVGSIPSIDRAIPAEILATFKDTVAAENQLGRIDWPGITGAMLTNIKASYQNRLDLGCYGQAEALRENLDLLHLAGWKFEVAYGRGLHSPIILPHHWVRGTSPDGHEFSLDPWLGEIR
jgi:hypothetical protein